MDESTRRVLAAVARHLEVDVAVLRGRDRTEQIVAARWVAMVVMRQRCRLSFRQLAMLLQRDVAAVWRAHRLALSLARTRSMAESVHRMLDQGSAKTLRAVEDIEDVFRRAREDAGAPPAKSTRGSAR